MAACALYVPVTYMVQGLKELDSSLKLCITLLSKYVYSRCFFPESSVNFPVYQEKEKLCYDWSYCEKCFLLKKKQTKKPIILSIQMDDAHLNVESWGKYNIYYFFWSIIILKNHGRWASPKNPTVMNLVIIVLEII